MENSIRSLDPIQKACSCQNAGCATPQEQADNILQLNQTVKESTTGKFSKHLDMMGYQDVAEYLTISVSTVKRWVQMEKVPYFKFCGSHVRFRKSEIDKWLEAGIETGKWNKEFSN